MARRPAWYGHDAEDDLEAVREEGLVAPAVWVIGDTIEGQDAEKQTCRVE